MSDVFNVNLQGWLKPVFTALALRAHGNAKDECWPSHERIARDTGCSRRTVIDAVAELERMGLIVRNRSNGRETTRYTINSARAARLTVHMPHTKDMKERRDKAMPNGADREGVDLPQRMRVIARRKQVRDGFLSMVALLGADGYVTVTGLAKELGMAPEKVRNDLIALFRSLDIPLDLHKRLRKSQRKPAHWRKLDAKVVNIWDMRR